MKKKKNNFSSLFNREVDYEITVIKHPNGQIAEAYRKIPLDIKYSQIDKDPKVIQITSTMAGEHKTTTIINLAAAYLELGKKVVILDADLRKPKLHYIFKLMNDEGLSSYLIDKISKEELINHTSYGIDIVTSGPSVPLPHVVLTSEKFKATVEMLREEYDIVLIDCPPVLVATDSLIISEICDTTLFVLNQEKARKSEVKEAIRVLKDSNVDLAGIIVTGLTKKMKDFKYHYGYKYRSYNE